jgi:FtsZ-binding cell division protein ZapB
VTTVTARKPMNHAAKVRAQRRRIIELLHEANKLREERNEWKARFDALIARMPVTR